MLYSLNAMVWCALLAKKAKGQDGFSSSTLGWCQLISWAAQKGWVKGCNHSAPPRFAQ